MKESARRRLDALDARLDDLLTQLEQYDRQQLNHRPASDRWSALMVMHHLMLAERGSLAYLRKKLGYQPKLKPAGLGDRLRSLGLTVFLNLPFKFKAPDVVAEEVLPVESTLEDTAVEWWSIRKDLRAFLEELPEEVWKKSVFKHALAGRMSLSGMLKFFEVHFDRHKKQIERTLGDFRSSVFE